MNKVIASAGVLALGALAVYSVRADDNNGSQLDSRTERPWSISGTLRGFYDDNYNTAPNNSPFRQGSGGFEVRPQVTFGHSSGSTTLNASYTYDERYYASRPGDKSDQSHDFELSMIHRFNERYSMDLLESFVDAQEPETIDASLSVPTRLNGSNYRNTAAVNFHAEATKLLGFVVGYANSWYNYTGNNPITTNGPTYGALLNRIENDVTLNSRWHVAPETTGILGYQFSAINYLSTDSLAPVNTFLPPGASYVAPNSRNYYANAVYVGVDHSLRSDWTVSLNAGAQVQDYYNSSTSLSPNVSSLCPYVELSSEYTYMEGGSLTVGFRHSLNPTDVAFDTSTATLTQNQESSSVYATVQQTLTPLSPRLVGRLTAQYQNSRFNGGFFNNERDNYYLLGLNLTYQFTRFLSAEIGYNYDDLVSQIQGRGYTRNRVYAGVTATY